MSTWQLATKAAWEKKGLRAPKSSHNQHSVHDTGHPQSQPLETKQASSSKQGSHKTYVEWMNETPHEFNVHEKQQPQKQHKHNKERRQGEDEKKDTTTRKDVHTRARNPRAGSRSCSPPTSPIRSARPPNFQPLLHNCSVAKRKVRESVVSECVCE